MLPNLSDMFEDDIHQCFMWEQDTDCAALLVHGYPGTPKEMRPLAEMLFDAGWAVQAPLLPGFGIEIEQLADKTHEEWIAHIEEAYLSLKAQYKRVVLFGFSMGGAICVNVAAKYSVDALVLFAPFWRIEHILWRALPVLRLAFPKVKPFKLFKPDFDDPDTREGIKTFMPEANLDNPEVQKQIREFEMPITMFNEIRKLGNKGYDVSEHIVSPVLVFQGKQDTLVIPDRTKQYLDKFSGDVTYHEVSAEHDLLDTGLSAWDTIQYEISEFLDKLSIGAR